MRKGGDIEVEGNERSEELKERRKEEGKKVKKGDGENERRERWMKERNKGDVK